MPASVQTLTSFDRVRLALEHREADRVPFDLSGSVLTGMNINTYRRLREYLGLPAREAELYDPVQQLGRVHEDVLERLEVDVRGVDPGVPENARQARPIEREGDYLMFTDEWGIRWAMPAAGGLYYDMVAHPLAEAETVADLEAFDWPDPLDPTRFSTMKERADRIVNEQQRAYILGRNAWGIFEQALCLRGHEKFFMDMALNPGFAEALLDLITENKLRYWLHALEVVGDNIMIVSEADDLCTQQAPMISLDMYRSLIGPRHRRLFEAIKQAARGRVYIFYHCCGAVKDFLPDLIENGVDILNPVQVNALGMDTKELKARFGADLSFWGGGIDTQHVLPRGSRQEIRDEVRRRIEDLAPGGGFVFNTVHNVQSDVPPENYMTMWETFHEFAAYA